MKYVKSFRQWSSKKLFKAIDVNRISYCLSGMDTQKNFLLNMKFYKTFGERGFCKIPNFVVDFFQQQPKLSKI